MTDLIPLCSLGGTAPRDVTIGKLRLSEVAAPVLTSIVRSDASGLPGPGRYSDGIFWTAPGQWMSERPDTGDVTTDQSDAWAVFEIEGEVEPLLQKLVNLDHSTFVAGSATRTGLEHMGVFVIRRAVDRVAIMAMRSAAGSVWHAIETAAERLEAA